MDINGLIRINIQKIVHETIDGETVILNLENGNYYSLVGVGGCIWEYLENGAAIKDINEKLRCNYECDGFDIEAPVTDFISELMKENLIVLDGSVNPGIVQSEAGQKTTDLNEKRYRFDPPVLNKYSDMQDLLLLDPIHEVDEKTGWPTNKPEMTSL